MHFILANYETAIKKYIKNSVLQRTQKEPKEVPWRLTSDLRREHTAIRKEPIAPSASIGDDIKSKTSSAASKIGDASPPAKR
jgi:hypothetical protein